MKLLDAAFTDSEWFSKDANADDAVTNNSNIHYFDFICVIMTAVLIYSQVALILDICFHWFTNFNA